MAVDLKDIVTISGHRGLFKSITVTQQGLVVESLDEHKQRSVKPIQRHAITTLEDVGIYTTGGEDILPLATVLWRLYADFGGLIKEDLYNTPEKLHALMYHLVPEYDPDRVYDSNIERILHWYNLLVKYTPELFTTAQDT